MLDVGRWILDIGCWLIRGRAKGLTNIQHLTSHILLVLLPVPAWSQSPFVMDAHVHMISRQFYRGGEITDSYSDGQVDVPRIEKGGLNAIFFSLASMEQYYPGRFEVKSTMQLMDLALLQLEKHRDRIELALSASDIDRIRKSSKIAALLDLEGGFDLDGDLGVLRTLYRLGLRSAMLPAHNFTNNFADSCCAPSKWNGINDRGRAVIHEMNRLGMLINVAHASNETILQTVEASRDPVLFSHGGSRHFVDIPRNLGDEAAKKIAAKGGVICLQFGNTFNNRDYYDTLPRNRVFGDVSTMLKQFTGLSMPEVDREVAKEWPGRPAAVPSEIAMGIDQLGTVIDYWVNLVGEDHVGLGSDLDGRPELPRGMKDIGDYGQIIEAIRRKGYADGRLRKIAGLNLLAW